jgi:hypothetical protein
MATNDNLFACDPVLSVPEKRMVSSMRANPELNPRLLTSFQLSFVKEMRDFPDKTAMLLDPAEKSVIENYRRLWSL